MNRKKRIEKHREIEHRWMIDNYFLLIPFLFVLYLIMGFVDGFTFWKIFVLILLVIMFIFYSRKETEFYSRERTEFLNLSSRVEKKTNVNKILTKPEILNELLGQTVFYNGELYKVYYDGFMEPKRGSIISWNMLTPRERINLKKQRKSFLEYLYDNIQN